MESVRKVSKNYYLRQIAACWLVFYMAIGIPAQVVMAVETPAAGALPDVVIDRMGIDAPVYTPGRMDMTQTAGEAIVNWQNFDIGTGATVEFHQPGIDAAVLNRVHDGDITGIMGTLTANGTVFVVNPAGTVIGSDASIDASQFVLSSLDIADADFLNGLPYTFTGGLTAGDVKNHGDITADAIALIGKNVLNKGALVANELVIMAAGDTVLISENGGTIAVEPSMGAGSPGDFVVNNHKDGDGITVGMGSDEENAHIILAAGDVWSTAMVKAYSDGGSDAVVATVTIDAAGDVTIKDPVIAEAAGGSGFDATAAITIEAGEDVEIKDYGFEGDDTTVTAKACGGLNNTATVTVEAGGNLEVKAEEGGKAWIHAEAGCAKNSNTANVTVNAEGDVRVIAECLGLPSEAEIAAITNGGMDNTSGVLICTDGGVNVEGISGGKARILADAKNAACDNTATVGIGAEGDQGVQVLADDRGEDPGYARIAARTESGETNTSETIICTQGGVQVVDVSEQTSYGGSTDAADAEIAATAVYGYENDAYVGICAADDVLVVAGIDPEELKNLGNGELPDGMGGRALIRAKASGYTTADAEVVVVSNDGGVGVASFTNLDQWRSDAGIWADASGAYANTASVGVSAGGDLLSEEHPLYGYTEGLSVAVGAFGDTCGQNYAYIGPQAHHGSENTADTVVCAAGEVRVSAEGQGGIIWSEITAEAGDFWSDADDESSNKATTQVYASEVKVEDYERDPIARIRAYTSGDGPDDKLVPSEEIAGEIIEEGKGFYCLTEHDEVAEISEDGSTLIIKGYGSRTYCPDCPPCPCEEFVVAPAAPLAQLLIPEITGCPIELEAAAQELGIAKETIQVSIGRALAFNPSTQPCEACATLIDTAAVLRDADGSRMAALNQLFNELASADAPFTAEMATSITVALAEGADDVGMPHYALAMEYIDAFVAYVAALEELGAPVGDSVEFAMAKYGGPVLGSDNANMAAYVQMRLAALGG